MRRTLILSLFLTLAACGEDEDPPPTDTTDVTDQSQETETNPTLGTVEGAVSYVDDTQNPAVSGPADGATVTALLADVVQGSATVGADGRYRLELPPGTYTIRAERMNATPDTKNDVVVAAAQSQTLDFTLYIEMIARKPNLYLYPLVPTRVWVTLETVPGFGVIESIPEYGDGWDVQVEPSGLIDGKYGYLYYEASVPPKVSKHEGWSVPANELMPFFERTMRAYGFQHNEIADFVDFWKTELPESPYYVVYPMLEVDHLVGLEITPKPDTLLRLWFVVEMAKGPVALPTPQVRTQERQGFVAFEWGVLY